MATEKQKLGHLGEILVIRNCSCPRCKKTGTLKQLRQNFKCADVICDFCGYLAQVKAITVTDIERLPKRVVGAAWSVQKERLDAGIYMPLFMVLIDDDGYYAIYYVAADLQSRRMFKPRRPLSARAHRHGWQGFVYDLTRVPSGAIVRIV